MFIRRLIFAGYLLFLALLSVCKSAEIFLPYIYQFEAYLGGDKLMHFKLALLLGVLAAVTFYRKQMLVVILLLVVALVIDESAQYVLSCRRFEWLDGLYGVAGLALGVLIGGLIKRFLSIRFGFVKNDG